MKSPESHNKAVSRRRFQASALGIAGLAAAQSLSSQEGRLSIRGRSSVDAKYANVLRKYGDRISEAQRIRVRETIVRHERMLERIRNFALTNADAPATGFELYPTENSRPKSE